MLKTNRRLWVQWVGVLLLLPLHLPAHQLETGQALLTLSADQVWILELEMNLTRYIQSNPALADPVRPEFRTLEKEGEFTDENFDRWERVFTRCEELFRKELKVIESGSETADFEVWFPHPSELSEIAFKTMSAEGLHVKIHASGRLATEDASLQFLFPLDVGEVVLTAVQPDVQWVVTGEVSRPLWLSPPGNAEASAGENIRSLFRYLKVGFIHIVPRGTDHILFVLGLFLLAPKLRPLLVQVTAFTAAHTLTLALSIYGVVSLPSGVVEPLIALSIAAVAIENVLTDSIHPWRPVLVFLFGLLHGLGFAGVLEEIGLPRAEFLWALVSFNVGVELGQLLVLALAFLVFGYFRKYGWYRTRLTIPSSCLIGLVGLYWTITRIFF